MKKRDEIVSALGRHDALGSPEEYKTRVKKRYHRAAAAAVPEDSE